MIDKEIFKKRMEILIAGRSLKSIADQASCDPKTIKNALNGQIPGVEILDRLLAGKKTIGWLLGETAEESAGHEQRDSQKTRPHQKTSSDLIPISEEQLKKDISNRIKSLRKPLENRHDFANRCGIPVATMSGYVNARKIPKIEHLICIASSCKVTLFWLFTGLEESFVYDPRLPYAPDHHPAPEEQIQKDSFDQAVDEFIKIVKDWLIAENGRNMKTAIEFCQEFPLRFPEISEWLRNRKK